MRCGRWDVHLTKHLAEASVDSPSFLVDGSASSCSARLACEDRCRIRGCRCLPNPKTNMGEHP